MTSIKSPTGPVSPGVGGLADTESLAGTSGAGAASGAVGASSAGAAQGATRAGAVAESSAEGSADAITELAAAIGRGEINATQAAEQLVQRAVSGMGEHLNEAERSELKAVLLAAFEGDPALRGALG
jgi:hypothetical protein